MSADSAVRPIVYLGPSAAPDLVHSLFPEAQIAPPIARDQLYRARERGCTSFVIIDGIFSHDLAVSPREIVDVARSGATIIGASSMGALRAAECWPAGVRGVGLIYRLFRLGALDSDDEVAVATDPDRGYASLSVALINVRYAVSSLLRKRLVDRDLATRIVEAAQSLFFADRTWSRILERARVDQADDRIATLCRGVDLKQRDALQAVRLAASSKRAGAPAQPITFSPAVRYPGHDPFFGVSPRQLQSDLARWIFATGRYQRFIWPLVLEAPELRQPSDEPAWSETRSEALREALALAIARLLGDFERASQRLWCELEFLEELEAETMRWYALHESARLARSYSLVPDAAVRQRVQDELAIAHGLRDWRMLRECVEDGRLFAAIPFDWINNAADCIATARTLRDQRGVRRRTGREHDVQRV